MRVLTPQSNFFGTTVVNTSFDEFLSHDIKSDCIILYSSPSSLSVPSALSVVKSFRYNRKRYDTPYKPLSTKKMTQSQISNSTSYDWKILSQKLFTNFIQKSINNYGN